MNHIYLFPRRYLRAEGFDLDIELAKIRHASGWRMSNAEIIPCIDDAFRLEIDFTHLPYLMTLAKAKASQERLPIIGMFTLIVLAVGRHSALMLDCLGLDIKVRDMRRTRFPSMPTMEDLLGWMINGTGQKTLSKEA
jgi:hypothetical protein